ncbi:MAG: thioredoxin [Candidatus Margulisiibacteriota bacterium]|nr:MAG: thioredoxin [Candidatus Margulisiibacteriota bacterium]
MKKTVIIIIGLALIVSGAYASGNFSKKTIKDKEPTANQKIARENPNSAVTFIELGSVNCVPCRMMQPVMDEVENKYKGQVKVVFHDVWTPEGRPFGEQYGIRAIPTQVFLDKEGKEYYRHVGFFPVDELEAVLKLKGVK